ncbi:MULTISPECIES: AAA family ATPase [unclassified Mesorhizobium]|uniref:AAA family ATPase n=2 Tax=Mesorhizobium TaxID=68287 RepID=UPI00142E968D|nr:MULTISPECIES: AAA family ATPase [unclassified Mesorhizobium]
MAPIPRLIRKTPTPTEIRLHLIDNGYPPIPTDGKRPRISNWSKIVATPASVASWERGYADHLNTGILTGRVVAVDVDAPDEDVAARLSELVRSVPGGEDALCRVGRAPKTLYVFRAEEPREKASTPVYIANGHRCQVEVLGSGQQFVAFGLHPDTGRPYEWIGSSPLDVAFEDLPLISPADLDRLLINAEKILSELGQPEKQPKAERHLNTGGETFWQRVNAAALDSPERWVTTLFPSARREAGTGAWRVTSQELGRPLQEDISIHPDGIQDFGKEQGETAINLVTEYGGASTAKDAALWLCERLGLDPESMGWSIAASTSSADDDTQEERARPKAANDNKPADDRWSGIISSGDLVRGFKPPDYAIEGIAQTSFIYSLTAMTGTGKTGVLLLLCAHTALGLPLAGREVRKGRVVYFAGENPDDVTMRWIGMAHHFPFDPETIDVHFIKGTFSIPAMFRKISAEVKRLGGADLIVIDTSAAYFQGSEENSNTELGKHARDLRTLTTLESSPCVLVAAHPTKSADQANLLPRGGGAFLNEVDGNLVLIKSDGVVKLHWHGKYRGADFDPLQFELKTVNAPQLKDSKGRDVPTVMASVVTSGEARARRDTARRDEDDLLLLIERDGKQSLHEMAETLGWSDAKGKPHKARAGRATHKLKAAKLAEYKERVGWNLTKAGLEAAVAVRSDRFREKQVSAFVRRNAGDYDEN